MAEYVAPVLAHCQAMAEKVPQPCPRGSGVQRIFEWPTQHPGLPLYIVGHSMGGLIALLAVLGAQVLSISHSSLSFHHYLISH
jgi:alpha-beta hydrolase superfamily lysophospholipase